MFLWRKAVKILAENAAPSPLKKGDKKQSNTPESVALFTVTIIFYF